MLLTHGDSILKVADGLKVIATHGKVVVGEWGDEEFVHFNHSRLGVAGVANEKAKLYGLQFHPEVDLSDNGIVMMKNFLFEVAKCKGSFCMKGREAACIDYIKETVGDHKVLVSFVPVHFLKNLPRPPRCWLAVESIRQCALLCCTKR